MKSNNYTYMEYSKFNDKEKFSSYYSNSYIDTHNYAIGKYLDRYNLYDLKNNSNTRWYILVLLSLSYVIL